MDRQARNLDHAVRAAKKLDAAGLKYLLKRIQDDLLPEKIRQDAMTPAEIKFYKQWEHVLGGQALRGGRK